MLTREAVAHLMTQTPARRVRRTSRARLAVPLVVAVGLGAVTTATTVGPAQAISTVTTASGAAWNVNDARRPGLDTGSIRNVSGSRVEGFGNLFVHVDGDSPRMNDQMMRGFGLTAASPGSYRSTASVRLGDVLMTRKLQVGAATDTAAFFDTFTNSSTEPVSIAVSFGGSLGYGTAPNTLGAIATTGSGDAIVDPGDTWVTAATTGFRSTGVVVGSGVDALGEQQSNPFTTPYVQSGSKANDLGFVQELTIEPGQTESLAQYVVVGGVDDAAVATRTAALAASPDFGNLTLDEICTLQNWDLAAYAAACTGAEPLQLPPAEAPRPTSTTVAYDVTGKTISELQADLRAGSVTSVQITKAYLDRIDAYDGGALGFGSFITVAKDAVAQALAADRTRAAGGAGAGSDLLGVPIALKDIYDTKDMATTGGTLALKDWEPGADAWQVAKLREAGAVIIGKTNLSEFANSGSFSESGFKQTWNAIYPSKTSFGSSGGSATAVGADLAPAAMGTQTGVSLYAPTTGASLATFRGTDGLTSTDGVMPLTWATDYAGPIAKNVTDLAAILDATATRSTGNNPADLLTSRVDNSLRPADYGSALRTDALQGKVIGYLPGSFQSTQVADDTAGPVALAQVTAALAAAGATLVPMTGAPVNPPASGFPVTGNAGAEGWQRYQATTRPATFPYTTEELFESQANLPYNVAANYTQQPMDDTSAANLLARRDAYKVNAATWMDTAAARPVDAVIYPGFLTAAGNNDTSSAVQSSDRATGVITQTIGLPTAVVPIGVNADGQGNTMQIVGRAWTDAAVLGMGYALEQQADGQLETTFAPALPFAGPVASVTSLALASTATTYGVPTTAAVTVASDPVATGPVSLSVDGRTVTGTLAGGTATLTLPAGVGVGTHLVTATYAGSAQVAPSSATTTLRVTRGTVTVAAELKRKRVNPWQRAKLLIDVAPAASAGGTVLVYDRGEVIKTVTLSATGDQRITLPRLGVGTHRIRAHVVTGIEYAAASSDRVTLQVRRR